MQPWAKCGVSAALVTGGMFAASSGVTSTAEACPDNPTSPWGEWAMAPGADRTGDPAPRRSESWFSGELFSEDSAPPPIRRPKHSLLPRTAPSPQDSWLPSGPDEALTQEFPALVEQGWTAPEQRDVPAMPEMLPAPAARPTPMPEPAPVPPAPPEPQVLEVAGWVVTPESFDDPTGSADGDRGIGTPAEGFHRSLSWAGPIGSVVRHQRVDPTPAEPTAHDFEQARTPVAESTGDQPGILDLWSAATRDNPPGNDVPASPAGLVLPSLDLTAGGLTSRPPHAVYAIPRSVVVPSLTTAPVPYRTRQAEFVPLRVPGEYQLKAEEIPFVTDWEKFHEARRAAARAAADARGPSPEPNRIASALGVQDLADDPPTLPAIPVVPPGAEPPTLPTIPRVAQQRVAPVFPRHANDSGRTRSTLGAPPWASSLVEPDLMSQDETRPLPVVRA